MACGMEKTVTDLLLETLEELGKDDLKRFKWKLKEIKVENQYNNIPWGKLETACPVDVAKELLNYYGEHYRVEVTIQVLRSIHRRDLADRLTKATKAGQGVTKFLLHTQAPMGFGILLQDLSIIVVKISQI
ncbi:unnamed protein product [Lepidochelys kempii]